MQKLQTGNWSAVGSVSFLEVKRLKAHKTKKHMQEGVPRHCLPVHNVFHKLQQCIIGFLTSLFVIKPSTSLIIRVSGGIYNNAISYQYGYVEVGTKCLNKTIHYMTISSISSIAFQYFVMLFELYCKNQKRKRRITRKHQYILKN